MIFDISELPESKYAFSRKCLYLYMYVCVFTLIENRPTSLVNQVNQMEAFLLKINIEI